MMEAWKLGEHLGAATDEGDAAIIAEAEQLLALEDDAGARALLDGALGAVRQTRDLARERTLVQALLALELHARRPAAALAHADRVVACARRLADRAGEADALLTVSDCARALERLPKAQQACTAALELFGELGDRRRCADAEYRLGTLAGRHNPELATAHYQRAMTLYTEADDDPGALRISNPPLPDPGADSRPIEAWVMVKTVQRDLDALQAQPEAPDTPPARTPRRVSPVTAPPAAPPPATAVSRREQMTAAAVLGGVTALFAAVMAISQRLPALSLPVGLLMSALLGAGAGVLAAAAGARGGLRAPALRRGVPVATATLVFALSAWVLPVRERGPAAPDLATAPIGDAELPPPAAAQPLTADSEAAARERFARALQDAEARGDQRAQADVLREHAAFEQSLGEHDTALTLRARSADLYRAAGATPDAADMVAANGTLLTRMHRLGAAGEQYARARALYEEAGAPAGELHTLRRLGSIERRRQRTGEARVAYEQALALARARDDAAAQRAGLRGRGSVARAPRDAPGARTPYAAALASAEAAGDRAAQVRAWLALAALDDAAGQNDAASQAWTRAVVLAEADGSARLHARARHQRARGAARLGQPAAARSDYQTALRLAAAAPPPDLQAAALVDLAALEVQAGQPAAARRYLEQALALYADLRHPARRARVLLALGDLDAVHGTPEAATRAWQEALDTLERTDDGEARLAALDRLQRVLADRNPGQAGAYAARAAVLRGDAAPTESDAGDAPPAR